MIFEWNGSFGIFLLHIAVQRQNCRYTVQYMYILSMTAQKVVYDCIIMYGVYNQYTFFVIFLLALALKFLIITIKHSLAFSYLHWLWCLQAELQVFLLLFPSTPLSTQIQNWDKQQRYLENQDSMLGLIL